MAENNEVLILTIKLQADGKNAKTISQLTKDQKKLAKAIKDAPKEGAKGYKELEGVLTKAKKQFADNAKEISKFNKELKTGEKQTTAKKTSLLGLSKTLKGLEKEYKNLTRAERNAAKGKKLQRSIAATRKELGRAERKLGDFRRSVGNYTKSLVGLNAGFGSLFISVGAFKNAIGGLGGAFRSAGAGAKALLLTLGPLALVLTGVTFALSKFESVTDSVKSSIAGLSAGFDIMLERLGRFGQAFAKLKSLDFEGFANDASAAFEGVGEEALKAQLIAEMLSKRLQKLRREEAAQIIPLAKIELAIAEAKRKSQEAELDNRGLALSEIEKAISLTEKQRDIEVKFATIRANIMQRQVALTKELTTIEDIEKANQASANAIKLAKNFENQLRKLIGRRVTLSRAVDKEEISALQKLQKEQAALTLTIKNQLLAREDATENILRFAVVTKELLDLEEQFKKLTGDLDKEVKLTTNSISAYNKEISDLTEKLESFNTSSAEYEITQKQITQLEAKRDAAVGSLTESIKQLNIAQKEAAKVLKDSEAEFRIRAASQLELEAIVGDSEEAAAKRIEIQEKLNNDLADIRINRIHDEQAALQEELSNVESNLRSELELFAGNELKKQEVLLIAQGKRDEIKQRALEFESELLDIGIDKFKNSEKDKTKATKAEEEKRKQLRDLAIDTSIEAANKIVELISVIQSQETEKQAAEIDKREEAQLAEAELLGKTEQEKQKIRDRFAKEREELERKAAAERKALAIADAVINIAGAVIKSLNTTPPVNVAFAAATAALGAIQLAIIAATNFAEGGLVKPVELSNGKIVNTPNIRQMSNGDNILATVRTNEVILNERQQRALGGASTFRSIGVPGFAGGGKADYKTISKALPFATGSRVTSFKSKPTTIRAFASGGAVSSQFAISGAIDKESKSLAEMIAKAVEIGAARGSKAGTENADITGQINKQNQRDARRSVNESV